jgi:hypothetical protein
MHELILQRHVREIARHRNVVWRLALQILDQRFQDVRAVRMPAAQAPRQPARRALAQQRADATRLHRRGMKIRDVSQRDDGGALAASLALTPPRTL